jgi:hypothetical protein
MSRKFKGYLGNPNLKEAGVKIDFTEEQIREYVRCSQDPIYFIKKYVKVVSLDKGLVPFELYDYQEDMINKMHNNRYLIAKLPRQSGKSTTIVAFILHYILFNQSMSVGILANKMNTAREILGRLRLAYEYLPKWLQQGIIEWNKTSIQLENGSKVMASATSSSAVRGGSFNLIFLDEFAHVSQNIAEEFFSSVYPTITSGQTTKVFMVSTPNGLNMFYSFWKGATRKQGEEGKNEYIPIEVSWRQVPKYSGGPLRDEQWKQQMIAQTSEQQFEQEFECSFLGSSNTLISASKLNLLQFDKPIAKEPGGLYIYDEPVEGHAYFIMVDVARGQGRDYTAMVVVDSTEKPHKVVARYRNNLISPFDVPPELYNLAIKYNNAHLLIEVNDIGGQIADAMHEDYEYENIIQTQMMGRAGQKVTLGFGRGTKQRGVRTSSAVKKLGCAVLKNLIEQDRLLVRDFDIIQELMTFVSKHQTFCADDGYTDDLVMCLVLFGWLTRQGYFEEIIDIQKKKIINTTEKEEEENTTFFMGSREFDSEKVFKEDNSLWFTEE